MGTPTPVYLQYVTQNWRIRKQDDGTYSPAAIQRLEEFYEHCQEKYPWMLKKKIAKIRQWQRVQWALCVLYLLAGDKNMFSDVFVTFMVALLEQLGSTWIETVLNRIQGGKLLWQIRHKVLQSVSEKLCDPQLGVIIVSLVKLSFQQWSMLITLFRKQWAGGSFGPIILSWTGTSEKYFSNTVPPLLPATKHVKVRIVDFVIITIMLNSIQKMWKTICKEAMKYTTFYVDKIVVQ